MKSLNKFKCFFENLVRSLGETDFKLMLYGKYVYFVVMYW